MSKESGTTTVKDYQTGGWKAHWILIICSLLYMVNYMDRTVLTIVVQPMKMELHLTDSQLGQVLTYFTLGIAFFSFPMAFMVDRWSRKKAVFIMAVLWSAATYWTGMAKSFLGVLFPRIIVGVGEAGFSAAGTAMITAAYPKKRHGTVLGIFSAVIPIGAALGTILGGYVSVTFGWRYAFYFFAVPGILLGIAALTMRDYKTVRVASDGGGLKNFFHSVRRILHIPTLRWLFIGYGIMLFMAMAVMSWSPAFIMRQFDVKENIAGLIAAISAPTAMVGALFGGWASDLWQKRNPRGRMLLPALTSSLSAILMIGTIVAALAAGGALTARQGIIISLVLVVLQQLVYTMGLPALSAVSQEVVHPAYKGLSWGLTVFCMYFLGGAWSPWITGAISDAIGGGAAGLGWAVVISCLGGLVAAVFFLIGSRHFVADSEKVKGAVIEAEQ